MAHVAKYQRAAIGGMLHHYRRDREATLERDNVDAERTTLNWTLGPGAGTDEISRRVEAVAEESGRAVRKNAVVMVDWVVTAPPDVREEDLRDFFDETYRFIADRYGEQNMLGGWVHMDEATPHMHCAFTPVMEKEDGRVAFDARTMVSRVDLKTFHDDLGDAVERRLGYRPMIRLPEEDRIGRALSRAKGMEDFQAMKDVVRATEERLERLRRSEGEIEAENRELEREGEDLERRAEELESGNIERAKTLEELREKNEVFERRIADAERQRDESRERVGVLERARDAVAERVERLAERIEAMKARVVDMVHGLEYGRLNEREQIAVDSFRRYEGRVEDWNALGGREALEEAREDMRPYERAADDAYDAMKEREGELRDSEERVRQSEYRIERLKEHPLRNAIELRAEKKELESAKEEAGFAKDRYDSAKYTHDKLRDSCERRREETVKPLERAERKMEAAEEKARTRYADLPERSQERVDRVMGSSFSMDIRQEVADDREQHVESRQSIDDMSREMDQSARALNSHERWMDWGMER